MKVNSEGSVELSLYIIVIALFISLLIVRMSLGHLNKFSNIEVGFATTPGNCEVNSDALDWSYYDEELLVVLGNGIGRETKGQTASLAATHTVSRVFGVAGSSDNPAYFFNTSFRGANNAILRYIPDGSAGTSLLAALIKEGRLYYALAGNCQIAVYRGGELIPLSEGHTFDVLVKKAFQNNKIRRVDALEAMEEKKVYNFLGKDSYKDLEIFDVPVVLKKGDIVVLMTDGVFDFHSYLEIEKRLHTRKSAKSQANAIIKDLEYEQYDYQDNATIAVIKINSV